MRLTSIYVYTRMLLFLKFLYTVKMKMYYFHVVTLRLQYKYFSVIRAL